MRSVGSTRRPGSVIVSPLTVTRPWAMSTSEARRDATPAAAMTFCRRSPSVDAPVTAGSPSVEVIEPVRAVIEQRRDLRQLVYRVDAELGEHQVGRPVVDRARLTVGECFRD